MAATSIPTSSQSNAGAEERYGDAVVPLAYMKRHRAPYVDLLDYVDKPKQFGQAVLVVRRTRYGTR